MIRITFLGDVIQPVEMGNVKARAGASDALVEVARRAGSRLVLRWCERSVSCSFQLAGGVGRGGGNARS